MSKLGAVEPPTSVRFEAAEYLAAANMKDITGARQPNLLLVLGPWFKQVEMLRDAAIEKIVVTTPTTEEMAAYKQILSLVIWQGEFLIDNLRQHDVTAQAGITLADVEATVEELYDRQRVFYGGMTEARRQQVLNEVFGAS